MRVISVVQRIVICDDNKKELEDAARLIREFFDEIKKDIEITQYRSGQSLVEDCQNGKIYPDILFIDIEMNGLTGIETVKYINQSIPQCSVVYMTNYLEYATEVYTTDHIYYVMKYELKQRLPEIYQKWLHLNQEYNEKVQIPIKNSGFEIVRLKDILYAERKNRITYIFTEKKVIQTKMKIVELEEILDESKIVRCHASFMVGMCHIIRFQREEILVKDGTKIPVSRRYQKEVREKYLQWFESHLF